MGPFSGARRAAPWVGLLLLLAACSAGGSAPSPSASGAVGASARPAATGLAHFSQDEWSFDYPAAWRYYPIEGFIFSFYSVQGYLASEPVDSAQGLPAHGQLRVLQRPRLRPGAGQRGDHHRQRRHADERPGRLLRPSCGRDADRGRRHGGDLQRGAAGI